MSFGVDGTYFSSSRPDMEKFLPTNYEKVLEIGCGDGGFSRYLDNSAELWGVEPNEESVCQARLKGYKMLQGDFEANCDRLPNNYFDLVICNDVIEHMADHDYFLSTIKEKMSSNGVLIGSVPNMRNYRALVELLVRKDWPYMEEGVLDRTHLRWFTEKSFKRSLIRHGYTIETYRGIGSLLGNYKSITSIAKSIVVVLIILSTFGYYRDIRYLQFAFRVKKKEMGSK